MKHPIQKLQDGDAVFNDDFVNAMAEGKQHKLKGGLDSILDKKKPKGLPKDDRKCSLFQKYEEAEHHSDGDQTPIKDDSFVKDDSYVEEEDEEDENKEPFLTQLSEWTPQKKDGLVQAEGSNLEDCMADWRKNQSTPMLVLNVFAVSASSMIQLPLKKAMKLSTR